MNEKWDNRFLDLCKFISNWSKDPSTKVGAVITNPDNSIVSVGYNGFSFGVEDTKERLENRDLKYKMVVHGEINAIVFAKKDLRSCTLYTYPFMPCSRCAAIVVQTGIRRVVAPINDNPRWAEEFEITKNIFKESGVVLDLKKYENFV